MRALYAAARPFLFRPLFRRGTAHSQVAPLLSRVQVKMASTSSMAEQPALDGRRSRSSSPAAKRLKADTDSEITAESSNLQATAPAPAASSSAPRKNGDAQNGNGNAEKLEKQAQKVAMRRAKMKRKDREKQMAKTGEEPIFFDIVDMLGREKVEAVVEEGQEFRDAFSIGQEVEVDIARLSSHGDGLAVAPDGDWVIAAPRCLPGERVRVRVFSNERLYSRADLLEVIRPAEGLRRDELIGCKYFGKCSGCQYQMLTYDEQLEIKRKVVQKAFDHFSGLDSSLLPAVLPTMPSPQAYGYRTKLTPHFDLPRELRQGRHRKKKDINVNVEDLQVDIGFDQAGTKRVMDIEECPIATATINRALPIERANVKAKIASYKNGATLLLRDSLESYDAVAEDSLAQSGELTSNPAAKAEPETVCVTNSKEVVKERVGDVKFDSPAGAFFQNNRSILPSLIEYVRSQIIGFTPSTGSGAGSEDPPERYLVDAYCGSGLFSLCLSNLFKEVSGVEISSDSIKYAKSNAELNGITNAKFLAGKAEEIFKEVTYPAEKTTVIIDPPRRGCDEEFVDQLVKLAPATIVYVSCNVHTQARDVGMLLRKAPDYKVLSIVGADLFPQTYHVEGVCVLRRE